MSDMSKANQHRRTGAAYLWRKVVGDKWGFLLLGAAPLCWALLAFNEIVRTDVIPGAPLASNALTICLYGFAVATVLSLFAGVAVSILCLVSRCGTRSLFTALVAHIAANRTRVFRSAVLLAVSAMAYFVGFELMGVVMTAVLAAGVIPFVPLAGDWGRQLRDKWRGGRARALDYTVYDGVAFTLMGFTLGAFLLLTFDTVDFTSWPKKAGKSGSEMLVGFAVCVIYGVLWWWFLKLTSEWPAWSREEMASAEKTGWTLASRVENSPVARREQSGEVRGRVLDKRARSLCLWLDVLILRVGLVQFVAFVLAMLICLTIAGILGAAGIRVGEIPAAGMFAETIADLRRVPEITGDLVGPRGAFLALILLLPCFGAYVLLAVTTECYETRRQESGTTVSAGQWNDLMAFIEPLGAALLGICALGGIGYLLGARTPEELSEARLYKFPWTMLVVVLLSFGSVYAIRFLGIRAHFLRRDADAYGQKLRKVFEDAVGVRPDLAEEVREKGAVGDNGRKARRRLVDAGLKTQELDRIKELSSIDGDLWDRFFSFERNVEERALLYLTLIKRWPSGTDYRLDGAGIPTQLTFLSSVPTTIPVATKEEIQEKRGGASDEVGAVPGTAESDQSPFDGSESKRQATHRVLPALSDPALVDTLWELAAKNFAFGSQDTGDAIEECPLKANHRLQEDFHAFVMLFAHYGRLLPVHSDEWRGIEKALYMQVTGSVFHKMKRYCHHRVPTSASHQEVEAELTIQTRGFFRIGSDCAMPDSFNKGSLRRALFAVAPHLLDWDHMLRSAKKGLVSKVIDSRNGVSHRITEDDKLILLLVPRQPAAITGLRFSNPLWEWAPTDSKEDKHRDLGGEEAWQTHYARSVYEKLVERLTACAGRDAQSEFRSTIYENAFIFENGLKETRSSEAE